MLVVAEGWLSPQIVREVQCLRGEVYFADGAIPKLENGRHVESADSSSWHVVIIRNSKVRACVRYQHIGNGDARIGGWAVGQELRGTTAAVKVAIECVHLARRLGDTRGIATATVRHESAAILRRLGGRLVMRYYDVAYGCEMERIEFYIEEIPRSRFGLLAA